MILFFIFLYRLLVSIDKSESSVRNKGGPVTVSYLKNVKKFQMLALTLALTPTSMRASTSISLLASTTTSKSILASTSIPFSAQFSSWDRQIKLSLNHH